MFRSFPITFSNYQHLPAVKWCPSGHLLHWHRVAAVSHLLPVVLKHHRLHIVQEGSHDLKTSHPPVVGWTFHHSKLANSFFFWLKIPVLWRFFPFETTLHRFFFEDAATDERLPTWKVVRFMEVSLDKRLPFLPSWLLMYFGWGENVLHLLSLIHTRSVFFVVSRFFLGGVYANQWYVGLNSFISISFYFIFWFFCSCVFCSLMFDRGLFLSTSV